MTDNSKVSFLRIHRSALLVSVLLVTSIAVSLYFGSFKPKATCAVTISWPLEFSVETDKTEFLEGENFSIRVSARNISNQTITLVQPSTYADGGNKTLFDYSVVDANNTTVYGWRKGRGSGAAIFYVTLKPNETHNTSFVWRQITSYPELKPVLKGTYSITGLLEVWCSEAGRMNLQTPAIMISIV